MSDEVQPAWDGSYADAARGLKSIADYTHKLGGIHAAFDGTSRSLTLLQEILLFFTQASVRIAQLKLGCAPGEGIAAIPRQKAVPDEA